MINVDGLEKVLNNYSNRWKDINTTLFFRDKDVEVVQTDLEYDPERAVLLFPNVLCRDLAFGKVRSKGIICRGFTPIETNALVDYLVNHKNEWWED